MREVICDAIVLQDLTLMFYLCFTEKLPRSNHRLNDASKGLMLSLRKIVKSILANE
jgi:hypothetical protein